MAQPVTVRPSPPPNPTLLPGTAPPPRSWSGLAIRSRERFFIGLATAATGLATIWSMISFGYSVMLRGAGTLPSESTLHLFTWQYRISDSAVFSSAEWLTPPLLVVGLLFAGLVLVEGVSQGLAAPIRKAQGKAVTVRWAAGGARTRAKAELRAAGYAGVVGASARVRLLVGVALVTVAGLFSFVLPLQDGFTRGLGPAVVGIAALVTVVSTLAATPWARWPRVVLFGDGTLTIDGHEPLAQVVPFPAPAPTPLPAPPPPVDAVPKVSGEPYPPPPTPVPPPPPHRWESF